MARFDTRRTNRDCSAHTWLTRSCPPAGGRWILVLSLLCFSGNSDAQIGSATGAVPKGRGTPPPAATTPAPSTSTPAPAAVPTPPPPPPPDPLGRNTPHGTVLGFLKAAEAQDYTRAAEYLDGKRTPEKAVELAGQLKTLLDLGDIDISSISRRRRAISTSRSASPARASASSRRRLAISMCCSTESNFVNQAPVWRFSQETLTRVPSAYASVRHRDIASYFPEWSTRIRFLSIPLWRWASSLSQLASTLLWPHFSPTCSCGCCSLLSRSRFTAPYLRAPWNMPSQSCALLSSASCLAVVLEIANDYALTALGRHFWSRHSNSS